MAVCSVTLVMLLFAEGRAVGFSAPWHTLSKPAPKGLHSAERLVALCDVEPDLKFDVHVLMLGAENCQGLLRGAGKEFPVGMLGGKVLFRASLCMWILCHQHVFACLCLKLSRYPHKRGNASK